MTIYLDLKRRKKSELWFMYFTILVLSVCRSASYTLPFYKLNWMVSRLQSRWVWSFLSCMKVGMWDKASVDKRGWGGEVVIVYWEVKLLDFRYGEPGPCSGVSATAHAQWQCCGL